MSVLGSRRFRLPKFRRYRPEAPVLDPYDPISSADPFYDGPTIEDFAPSPPRPRSPLSRWPDPRSARPALFCFALFWLASVHDWRLASDGGSGMGLWASGDTVFNRHQYWRLVTA